MLFQPVELKDRLKIYTALYHAEKPICDLSFANLYGWAIRYETSWGYTSEEVLVIRFKSIYFDHPVYLLPYCPKKEVWERTILELREETKKASIPLIFMGVTPECAEHLETSFPEQFSFSWNDNDADYIYLRDKLVALNGKKLQSKRNHLNKFKKLSDTRRDTILYLFV